MKKGMAVIIHGSVQQESYMKDGKEKISTRLICDRVYDLEWPANEDKPKPVKRNEAKDEDEVLF